jgi:uncharacterized protein YodC (DUF2158 family)
VDFKVGDTVILKSGGPPMTVIRATQSNAVLCIWLISDPPPRIGAAEFHCDLLELGDF